MSYPERGIQGGIHALQTKTELLLTVQLNRNYLSSHKFRYQKF